MTDQSKDVISRLRVKIEEQLNNGSLDDIQPGLQVHLGRASYSGENIYPITFKFEVSATNDDGIIETKEVRDFKASAFLYGLSADDLGKEFTIKKDTYKITGLNRRRKKFPISGINIETGKSFKFPADDVKYYLEYEAWD